MNVIVTTMASVGDADDLLARLSDPGTRLACFYCAPWDAAFSVDGDDAPAAGGTPEWSREWIRRHVAMLKAWQAAPDRVVLVNSVRAGGAQAVAARLAGFSLALDADRVPAVAGEGAPAWTRALAAAHFAELSPEAWECYEALESCAQVTGDEPELRATMSLGDATDLGWIMGRLRDALEEGADSERDRAQLAADLEHAVARMESLDEAASARRRENELLLDQIEQFNAELERVEAARTESEASLQELREQVELDASRPVDDELPALRRENELLVLQLEQLHEELEQSAGQARAATRVAERAASLGERARMTLSRLALHDRGA